MKKSRISFSISKKASKNDGGEPSQHATADVPSTNQKPTLRPSSYFACRFCCKRFKSVKSYESHSKTKNHLKAVKDGSESELTKSRTCAGCQQAFDSRPQLADHCRRFSHMPLVQKTGLKNPVYGKAYTEAEQEDPFVSIKYYSPYYCEVCDLDCVSDVHYQDHVKGTRHQKAMEKRAEQGGGVLVELDITEIDSSEKYLVIMNKVEPVTETVSAYYCGICDTDCRSELVYTEHVTGKDHQIRMQGHGQMKISCDLCGMTFTSENNYKMHLKSKKHANNVTAKQRLRPFDTPETEKGESVQDLRDKIKRTLSPPLDNFDKIKVNVAVAPQESAVRSVVINEEELEEEAEFMQMGKPNVEGKQRKTESGNNRDKKERKPGAERKLKEDEEEREKWAKKKEEEYARRKAETEKFKGSERDRSGRNTSERRGPPRGGGRGAKGWSRGRGGRGGRFGKDDKFTWVQPGSDDGGKSVSGKGDSYRQRPLKNDRKGDKEDKSGKRDNKSERRERRRSYDGERDRKKYDSDSDDEYSERVILKKGEAKTERSPSPDDDSDDLRNVINKQRGKAKGSTEGPLADQSDDDYEMKHLAGGEAGHEDGKNSLVFDYGHKHMDRTKGEEGRGVGNRAELKGFFGGALSSLAGHFHRPGYDGEEEFTSETDRYYDDQRPIHASRAESSFEKVPQIQQEREDPTQNVERQLLLELLKRQFPDIRFLMEQQGGLELMQRIFGESGKARGFSLGGIGAGFGGGSRGSDDSGGSFERGLEGESDGGRKVYSVSGRDEVNVERGFQRRVVTDDEGLHDYVNDGRIESSQFRREQGDSLPGFVKSSSDESRRFLVGARQSKEGLPIEVMSAEENEKSSKLKSAGEEKSRIGKREPEKRVIKGNQDSNKGRKRSNSRSRSRSRDRRKRSRSRSTSRSRGKNGSRYSSSKRSTSSSRERSSSKKSRRSPSPSKTSKKDDAKSTSKRKRSVSPKRGEKEKVGKKDGAEKISKYSEKGDEKNDKRSDRDKQDSLVMQMKAISKDAKEKVLAKWTVQNWSGKEENSKSLGPRDEETVRKMTGEKDKKSEKVGSKRYDRKGEEEASDQEQTLRRSGDRAERKVSSKEEPSSGRSHKASQQEYENRKRDVETRETRISKSDKIFDDTSDYEEIDLDDIRERRGLTQQFEEDYEMSETQVEMRREAIDDRGLLLSRQLQRGSFSSKEVLPETTAAIERRVSKVEDIRSRISESIVKAKEEAEFDPYSYENRAFDAQEDLGDQGDLHPELVASLARVGIPYQNFLQERLGARQTFPLVSNYLSSVDRTNTGRELGLALEGGLVQGSGLARGQGLVPGRGSAPGHGLAPGSRLIPGSEMAPGNGLAPGSGLGLGRGLPFGQGLAHGSNLAQASFAPGRNISSAGGRSGRGRPVSSGTRNTSALMYIQPTEDEDQGRQAGMGSRERTINVSQSGSRLATSQASVVRGAVEKAIPTTVSAALRTVSPVPLGPGPQVGKHEHESASRSLIQRQLTKTVLDTQLEEDRVEEDFANVSDTDLYGTDSASSRPLKSILKKQSKFSTTANVRSQQSDADVLASGNLPKNVVGAEYVVQSSGEQGKFFCQLCDVQFTTLSAKNLHLRGPKHLAMFMKHKSPLIDQMIQQAMGKNMAQEEDDTMNVQKKVSERDREDLDVRNETLRGQIRREWHETGAVTEDQGQMRSKPDSDDLYPARTGVRSLDSTEKPRVVGDAESMPGYPLGEEIIDESRMCIDDKTGRIVQSQRYYRENFSREGAIPEEYGRLTSREGTYSQSDSARGGDDRTGMREDSLVQPREEYGRLLSRGEDLPTREEYSQLISREKDLRSREEYGRLPPERERRLATPREQYDRPLRREGSLPTMKQEYSRFSAREAGLSPGPDEYGRVPYRETRPGIDDYSRFSTREESLQLARDDPRRLPPREQSLPLSEDIGRPPSREVYGRLSSRESYSDEKDWRGGRLGGVPPLQRDRPSDQSRIDWSAARSYDKYDERRTRAQEPFPAQGRQPREVSANPQSQYIAPGQERDSPSREWAAEGANAKEIPKTVVDDPKEAVSEQSARRPAESPTGFAKLEDQKESTEEVGKQRENSERYGSSYESRSPTDRREAPGDTYGQQYDKSYGDEQRYRNTLPSRNNRHDQSGYGYNDPSRRGGPRGTRGRGGPGVGPRGGQRGYPRKPGFNRPPRQWKGGQGRY